MVPISTADEAVAGAAFEALLQLWVYGFPRRLSRLSAVALAMDGVLAEWHVAVSRLFRSIGMPAPAADRRRMDCIDATLFGTSGTWKSSDCRQLCRAVCTALARSSAIARADIAARTVCPQHSRHCVAMAARRCRCGRHDSPTSRTSPLSKGPLMQRSVRHSHGSLTYRIPTVSCVC